MLLVSRRLIINGELISSWPLPGVQFLARIINKMAPEKKWEKHSAILVPIALFASSRVKTPPAKKSEKLWAEKREVRSLFAPGLSPFSAPRFSRAASQLTARLE